MADSALFVHSYREDPDLIKFNMLRLQVYNERYRNCIGNIVRAHCIYITASKQLLSEISNHTLTNCLKFLEDTCYTDNTAIFVLANFQQLNQIGGIR